MVKKYGGNYRLSTALLLLVQKAVVAAYSIFFQAAHGTAAVEHKDNFVKSRFYINHACVLLCFTELIIAGGSLKQVAR